MTLLDLYKVAEYRTDLKVYAQDHNSLYFVYTGLVDDLPDNLMDEVVVSVTPYGYTDPISKVVHVGLVVYVDYNIHATIELRNAKEE